MSSAAVFALAGDIVAAADSVEPPRSWWPWLAGFLPGALVIAALILILRWLRARRSAPTSPKASGRP